MKRMVFLAFLVAVAFPAVLAADGFIVVPEAPHHVPGHFSFAPLEVVFHKVTVAVKDLVATTTVDQEFFNPNNARLEGTYLFPLPAGAHIDRFSLDIDGRMMEAELLSADKARAIYEDIVRRAKDPALLEYAGRDAFKVRIFPIEPHARKRVRITYTQLLRSDAGLVEYVYPLNTEKFSSAPLEAVSVVVTLDGKQPLKTVYCPSHDADVRRDGERRAVVGWEARNAWPDTDFKVVFSRTPDPLGIDLVTHRPAGAEGTFLLMISPGFTAEKSAVQPKDICFVLDTSGSMASEKLEQARRALSFCLANLGAEDRFEIVRFSTEAEPLFGRLEPVSRDALKRAEVFVAGLKPIGGTAIDDALDQALALRGATRSADAARPYLVVFLTDGLPTVGETREDTIVARVKNAAAGTRDLLLRHRHGRQHPPPRPDQRRHARPQPVRAAGRGHRGEGEQLLLQDPRPGALRSRALVHQPIDPGDGHAPPGAAGPLQRRRAGGLRPLHRFGGRGGQGDRARTAGNAASSSRT